MSQPPGSGPYVPSGVPGPYAQGPIPSPGPGSAWPAPNQAPYAPQPPTRPRRPWLAVGALVLGLGVVFGGTFLAGRLTAPRAVAPVATNSAPSVVATAVPTGSVSASSRPSAGTPTKGFTYNGSSLVGLNYTATLPTGWHVSSSNGNGNDGAAIGESGEIAYWAGSLVGAATLCHNVVASISAAPSDVSTDVAGVTWGSLRTVATSVLTKSLDTGEPVAYTVYCVGLPTGATSLLMASSTPSKLAAHRAVVEPFLAAWVWR